jgi:hypothetical protein
MGRTVFLEALGISGEVLPGEGTIVTLGIIGVAWSHPEPGCLSRIVLARSTAAYVDAVELRIDTSTVLSGPSLADVDLRGFPSIILQPGAVPTVVFRNRGDGARQIHALLEVERYESRQ